MDNMILPQYCKEKTYLMGCGDFTPASFIAWRLDLTGPAVRPPLLGRLVVCSGGAGSLMTANSNYSFWIVKELTIDFKSDFGIGNLKTVTIAYPTVSLTTCFNQRKWRRSIQTFTISTFLLSLLGESIRCQIKRLSTWYISVTFTKGGKVAAVIFQI